MDGYTQFARDQLRKASPIVLYLTPLHLMSKKNFWKQKLTGQAILPLLFEAWFHRFRNSNGLT